ncbi:MAG: sigma-70 family RNA polymerase sigma factor [Solirubrobacteraceae bacterium]
MEVSALKPPVAPGLRTPSALLRLQSDERLIAMIRRGQHAAFETLFSRYQSRLLAFCRHMLGSKEDAEDVLQEVFAAAFNAILADEREINVRPWLYRIARNRSLNHLRKASAIGVDSMDVHYAENGVSTAEKVMRRESFRQLIGDVQQLPETQRTALLLREIDALSYEQISDAMETTVPAVKSLLVRARISLAEASEARKLTCDEVRMELGEVAEGLIKLTPAVRRHVRDCERCRSFKKHLKENNVALAAIMPVAPLFLLKKLVLSKLGGTAGAGGAHVAGAGAGGAGAAAGATAAGGASAGGGLLTAGAGALATKAVAGLAVAAIVTAGTVEAEHTTARTHHHHSAIATASAPEISRAGEPVVTRSLAQPTSVAGSTGTPRPHRHLAKLAVKPKAPEASAPVTASTPALKSVQTTTTVAEKPPTPPVTQVTTESTQLPSDQTQPPSGEPTTVDTSTPTATVTTGGTEATPPPSTTTTPAPPPPPPPTSGAGEAAGSDPVEVGTTPPDPGVGTPGTEVTAP